MEPYYFLGAPHPHPTESLSSWFQRFSQQQGVGFQRALSIFDIPLNTDLDFEVNESIIQKISQTCSIPVLRFNTCQSISRTIRNTRAVRKKLRTTPLGEATTAICAQCLQNEEQPYFRIEWRFSFWKICPIHRTRLDHVCRNCSNQIILEKSILTAIIPTPTLNHCKYCLTEFNACITTNLNTLPECKIDDEIEIQKKLMATILHGFGHIAPLKKRVTPTVLIRLLDAGLIVPGVCADFIMNSL